MSDKSKKLQKALYRLENIGDFEDREFPSTEDWMEFLQVFHQVTSQGSGLTWSEIKPIVHNVIMHGWES